MDPIVTSDVTLFTRTVASCLTKSEPLDLPDSGGTAGPETWSQNCNGSVGGPPGDMEPNLRQTYLSELGERIEDFSAIWPRFREECSRFDRSDLSALEIQKNRWRIRKWAAELLITSAQIGRILDPNPMRGTEQFKESCRERGRALRDELNVLPSSPLLDRTLRNALEHIDEYIDSWIAENPNRPLETWALTTTAPGETALDQTIRRIHVRTLDVFVLDKQANLEAIRQAVLALFRSLPAVQRSEMILRFDDPSVRSSDVIAVRRVHSAGESVAPDTPED
ncbi:MAG: hypothetical protein WB789_04890 [Thermoplasmata archaeon]